jgi:NAD(P)-dependent dehydrogenase (short-subunit alcohol dehydrogenase family)
MDLTNSVVLVTGATGGLGQQFVTQSLARGASKVYAGARRDHDWADPRVVPLRLEVTDPAAITAAVEAAGDVTVLVNNAGINGAPSLLTSSEEDIRKTFEVHVFAPLLLTRAFAPVLARNGGGAVINVASVLSWLTMPGAYAPSKTAFWGLTNALRLELAGQQTQVLGAHLGYTDTPLIAHLDVAKEDPADIVANILDALVKGEDEAIADNTSARIRSILPVMTTGVPPQQ